MNREPGYYVVLTSGDLVTDVLLGPFTDFSEANVARTAPGVRPDTCICYWGWLEIPMEDAGRVEALLKH